jgi:hypothetical protein
MEVAAGQMIRLSGAVGEAMKNLIFIFGFIIVTGCNRSVEPQTINLFRANYAVVQNKLSQSVDISKAAIIGYCSKDEKRAIAKCLGGIQISNIVIKEIDVVWTEERVAAKVTVKNSNGLTDLIFLEKQKDQQWVIAGSTEIIY